MARIEIYTKSWCGYCHQAKALLKQKQTVYEEIDVTEDEVREQEMNERSKRYTVPQIFIDGRHIGGCDDLYALDAAGKLDPLLV